MEIWINPACSKCRSALTVLDAEGADYTVRRYLEDVPSEDEIAAVLDRLGLEPWDITRTQETVAAELGLKDWARDASARGRWITALAAHPGSSSAPSSRRTTAARWWPAPTRPYGTRCPVRGAPAGRTTIRPAAGVGAPRTATLRRHDLR